MQSRVSTANPMAILGRFDLGEGEVTTLHLEVVVEDPHPDRESLSPLMDK